MFKIITLIISLSTILLAQVPQVGLVAYYPFDGNLNDESGNNNHGISRGILSYSDDRLQNPTKALYFNGTNGYIDIPNPTIYPSITVSLWFNLSALPENWLHSDSFYLVEKDNSGGYTFNYLRLENGIYRLQTQIWTIDHWATYYHEIVLDINRWYHFVSSYDAVTQSLKVFLDGSLIISANSVAPTSGDDYRTTDESHIGRYLLFYPENPGADLFFGKLDEFRLYNRALSDTEILSLYTSELPVELTSFKYITLENSVKLIWQTSTEINNLGFDIERKQEHSTWEKIGFTRGNGNCTSPKEYFYIDNNPSCGLLKYRLKQIDFDGKYEYSKEVEVSLDIPQKFSVRQNFPNPFNPSTKIEFSIPSDNIVEIRVFNLLGMEVATLLNEHKRAGMYSVEFFSSNLSSGIYFYKIVSGKYSDIKKMILLR